MAQVLVVESDLKHLLEQTQKYQQDITDLTSLYEAANGQNQQHLEELKQARSELAAAQEQLQRAQEENEGYKELLKARDSQLTILQRQLVEFAQNSPTIDANLGASLLPAGGQLCDELQALRAALSQPAMQEKIEEEQAREAQDAGQLAAELQQLRQQNDELSLQLEKCKFQQQLPENAVLRQLEAKIADQKAALEDGKRQASELQQRLQQYGQLQLSFEQLQQQSEQQRAQLGEKDADILQLIAEFQKLQQDNAEMQQALDGQIDFAAGKAAQITQTDLTAENAVIELQADFQQLLAEVQQKIQAAADETIGGICEAVATHTQHAVDRDQLLYSIQQICSENEKLRDDALQRAPQAAGGAGCTSQCLQLKDDNEILSKQVVALNEQIAQLNLQIAGGKADTQALQDQIIEMTKQSTAQSLASETQQNKIAELQENLEKARETLEKYASNAEELEETEMKLQNLQSDLPPLKGENEAVKQLNFDEEQQITSLKKEQEESQLYIQQLNDENKQLKLSLQQTESTYNEEKQELAMQLSDKNTELEALQAENERLRVDVEQLRKSTSDLSAQLQELERKNLDSDNILQQQQNDLLKTTNERETAGYVAAEYKQQIKDQNIELEKLRNEKEELILKIADYKININEQQNDIRILSETTKQELSELGNENKILQTQNTDFKAILEKKNAEISGLEAELVKYELDQKEGQLEVERAKKQQNELVERLNIEVKELELEIERDGEQKDRLEREVSELTTVNHEKEAEIDARALEIESLQNELKDLMQNRANFELEINHLTVEKANIEEDLKQTQLQLNEREDDFLAQTELIKTKYEDFTQKQVDREKSNLLTRIQELEQANGEKQDKMNAVMEELERAKNQIELQNNDLEALKIKLAQTEELSERLRQNAAEIKQRLQAQIAEKDVKLHQLSQSYETEQMNFKLLQAEESQEVRDDYNAEVEELVSEIKDLQLENERFKANASNYELEIDKAQQEKDILAQKLSDTDKNYQHEISSAQKYKELYKKAYDVVERLKAKESQSKAVILDLEQRVKAIEARKSEKRSNWDDKW